MNRPKFLAVPALWLLAAVPAAPADEGVKFLPFMAPRLEAARYSPANEEFAWVGWIGVVVDLVQKDKWGAYFNANVEAILGSRVRSFEAVQANYSLDAGLHRDGDRGRLALFVHHVSRHVQDRDKLQPVDWNFLGVRYDSPWPGNWNRRGAFSASFAVATLASAVDYNWEARASGDIDLLRQGNRALFLLADVRYVDAGASADFPRDQLTDVRVELGFRYWQGKSQSALFVAYEHRNDALIPRGLVIDRALLGLRIRGHNRSAPAVSSLP